MLATAIVALLSLSLLARSQIITPPSAVQCQPVLLTWTASANPPYIVSVLPGGQVSAAAIENIGTFTTTSVTWKVDIPAGTNITLQLRDASGQPFYSAPFLIQSSSDTSCLGTNAGYVGGAGLPAPSSVSSTSGSSSASGSGTSSATSTSASSSGVSSTSSASSASSTSATSASHSATSSATSASANSASHSSTSTSAASSTPTSGALSLATIDIRIAGLAGLLGALLFA